MGEGRAHVVRRDCAFVWGVRLLKPLFRFGLFLLCLGVLCPAARAASRVEVRAEAGFSGRVWSNAHFPLRVSITNRGQAFHGSIVLERKRDNKLVWQRTLDVSVPDGESVFTTTALAGWLHEGLRVTVLDRGSAVARTDVTLGSIPPEEAVVCVIGESSGKLKRLFGLQPLTPLAFESVQTQARASGPGPYGGSPPSGPPPASSGQSVSALPRQTVSHLHSMSSSECYEEAAAYECVSCVVLAGFTPRDATPGALKALEEYAASGGVIVVAASPDVGVFGHPFYRKILPGTVTAPSAATPPGFPGQVFCASFAPSPRSRVFASWSGKPVVVGRPLGNGAVVFLSVDPAGEALQTWSGYDAFMQQALTTALWAAPYYAGDAEPDVQDTVQQMPRAAPPSIALVGLFLLAYVIILVPVNYAVMSRRDRKEWAWASTPAIVLVFTALAWFIGLGMRGGDLAMNELVVVEGRVGDRLATVRSYIALFAPASRKYTINAPGGTIVRPMSGVPDYGWRPRYDVPMSVTDRDGRTDIGLSARMWTTSTIELSLDGDVGGSIDGRARVGPSGITGELTNNTGRHLEEVFVNLQSEHFSLGPMKPGSTASFRSSGKPPGRKPPAAEADFSEKLISRIRSSGMASPEGATDATVLAFARGSAMDLRFRPSCDRRQALTAYVVHLPVRVEPGASSVQVRLYPYYQSVSGKPGAAAAPIICYGARAVDVWSTASATRIEVSGLAAGGSVAAWDWNARVWRGLRSTPGGDWVAQDPTALLAGGALFLRAQGRSAGTGQPSALLSFGEGR